MANNSLVSYSSKDYVDGLMGLSSTGLIWNDLILEIYRVWATDCWLI